jgi:acetylornithine deacetylase/succinyl-diaminopimelate desuccinylase-like protein
MRNPDASDVLSLITPDAIKQTLLDMIDIRSPTGHEAGMAEYIIQQFRRAGIDAEAQPVQPGRPNAIAHLPGSGSGTNLLFTGHMDTSYSGDEEHLVGEGFRPKGIYRDGWIWGLGANNMKSGLAGLLVAMEAIAKAGVSLPGDLVFGGVVGEIEKAPVEEFQGADYSGYGVGTKHMVGHGVTADYALLAEPTALRICTANMGCIWVKITLHGSVAHSALTNKPGTVNAIDLARSLCDDIDRWAADFRTANTAMGEQANVTLACIKAGAPWRLSRNPHGCSVYLDIRTVPGQHADDVKRQLRSVLRNFAYRTKAKEPSLSFLVTDPPLMIDEGLPVVDALRGAQEKIMGQATEAFLRRPGSDAVHLSRYDVPCVQFGPGGRLHPDAKGRSMHEVGDHVLLDDVVAAARIYAAAALDVCNRPPLRRN